MIKRFLNKTNVIISQVEGYKPREPFHVYNRTKLVPVGNEKVDILSTSQYSTLTAPTYNTINHSSKAKITVEDNDIRYSTFGSFVNANLGHIAAVGETIWLDSIEEIKGFKAISTADTASIQVTYYEVVSDIS